MGNTFVQEISPLQIQTTKNLKGIVDNTEIQVGNDEIVWDIVTTCERNYTISRTNPSGTTMRGQGGSAFDLYFNTKCFSKGDVIMSEKQYHLRLQDDMVQTGYGWKA